MKVSEAIVAMQYKQQQSLINQKVLWLVTAIKSFEATATIFGTSLVAAFIAVGMDVQSIDFPWKLLLILLLAL